MRFCWMILLSVFCVPYPLSTSSKISISPNEMGHGIAGHTGTKGAGDTSDVISGFLFSSTVSAGFTSSQKCTLLRFRSFGEEPPALSMLGEAGGTRLGLRG